jgi:hypothetical protein
MTAEPIATAFVGTAKAQTLHRDFNALRRAIRAHDTFATEEAWERCERWIGCIQTVRTPTTPQEVK